MPGNTVYVITGGNRGIGLGLVKAFLAKPSTTVVASVRNETALTSLKKEQMTLGSGSKLHIIILNFGRAIPPDTVRMAFESATGGELDHVDVLINNAAVDPPFTPAAETSAEDLRTAYETNAIAPLMMFQGLWPLLQKSTSAPKLINVTSTVGGITLQEPFPGGSYGPSKAALNWITRALHLQNEASGLIAVALHPGWVQTRSGYNVAKEWNYASGPPTTIEDCISGMVEVIDEATRETVGGEFVLFSGEKWKW